MGCSHIMFYFWYDAFNTPHGWNPPTDSENPPKYKVKGIPVAAGTNPDTIQQRTSVWSNSEALQLYITV